MSPTIISDPHNKEPLNSTELAEFEVNKTIDSCIIHDVGPDELSIKFSLVEGADSGTVLVEVINDDTDNDVVGNVDFKKLDSAGTCLQNGVQIKSAYFNTDFRGLGLGITSYELITKHYLLVSDTIQTHDGSAFWKFKLGDHHSLEVNIVVTPESGTPYRICDEQSQPIIYHFTKENLEPMIWGLECPNSPTPSINASLDSTRNDVVLVAIQRS